MNDLNDSSGERGGSCAPAPCSARSSDNKIGDFRKELERLLNCMSMENRSDTPDFILAQYMTDCLEAHDRAVNRREVWYGRKTGEPDEGDKHAEMDAYGKANGLTVVFAPWHPNPEYRIFKTGSLLSRNEEYPSGLVIVNERGVPQPWQAPNDPDQRRRANDSQQP